MTLQHDTVNIRVSRCGGIYLKLGTCQSNRASIVAVAAKLIEPCGGAGQVTKLTESNIDPGLYYTAMYRQDSTGASAEFDVKITPMTQ